MRIGRASLCMALFIGSCGALAKPKYGPGVSLLRDDHGYLQSHQAPMYWELSPYYLAQRNDESCSLATVAMVVNAARLPATLSSEDQLATQDGLLTRVKSPVWTAGTAPGGPGVTLDQLAELTGASLKAFGVTGFRIDTVHVATPGPSERAALLAALAAGERSGKVMIVANFLDGVLTGDGSTGHFSPLGAYDAANGRVLVLDVDRAWYEPYWVTVDMLLNGMATVDPDARKPRGYYRILTQ